MDSCDIAIVGGGPAGSSCAWRLANSGLDVVLLDRQVFPRDKVCGGWITPPVLTALSIDLAEYSAGRVLQPISGFRVGCIGSNVAQQSDYGEPVSYGIRRREFDHYLLQRCGARIYEGVSFSGLERMGQGWLVNGNLKARVVVGAGGHFCPVARHFSAKHSENPVVAQEVEFEMEPSQLAMFPLQATTPELYFCPDLKGYGWCFRKGNFVNIGLGREDPHGLPRHVDAFLRFLAVTRGLAFERTLLHGHAYLLCGSSPRPLSGDGFLLVGDAAGLAGAQSGEGIRPAVESGILAAEAILAAHGDFSEAGLAPYALRVARLFGAGGDTWAARAGNLLSPKIKRFAAARLMETGWFVRRVVLDKWFLRRAR